MNIRPLHDRVIVRRKEEERTTAGGIVIPDSATEKPSMGEILATGHGKVTDSGDVHQRKKERGGVDVVEEGTAKNTPIPVMYAPWM